MNIKIFPEWTGELGWELMTWQARCRYEAREFDISVVQSFPEMEPIYKDFAVFQPHNKVGRGLDFKPKKYRVKHQEFIRFGNPKKVKKIVIHARGFRRCSFKNYKNWEEVVNAFPGDIACVGTEDDMAFGKDLRGLDLQGTMDVLAGADVVVGGSSGVMHLASLCGTQHIVWGDNKTHFGERLEKRYKETWNPLQTKVHWIEAEKWQPKPEKIIWRIADVI